MNAAVAEQQQNSARRNTPHGFEEKKYVVDLYRQGLGSKRISRIVKIDDGTIRRWLKKYREHGLESLRPYWREKSVEKPQGARELGWQVKEKTFSAAYPVYAGTLESVASIARRYGFDYFAFKYHVERYHPELVHQREALAGIRVFD